MEKIIRESAFDKKPGLKFNHRHSNNWGLGRLAAARGLRGLGLLLYGSNMAGGRYTYPYGPSPTDESLKLRVLDDEKHSIVFD